MDEELSQILDFIKLIDEAKLIERKIILRRKLPENNAEHSWHVVMMIWLLSKFYSRKLNLLKAIKMGLIHDLVEIYAGDTFAYDLEARKTKTEREEKAAKLLFKKLPTDLAQELDNLWREYEEDKTPEARFVQAMDKLQPLIQNILVKGKQAIKYKVSEQMIREQKSKHFQKDKLLITLFNQLLTDNKDLLHKS